MTGYYAGPARMDGGLEHSGSDDDAAAHPVTCRTDERRMEGAAEQERSPHAEAPPHHGPRGEPAMEGPVSPVGKNVVELAHPAPFDERTLAIVTDAGDHRSPIPRITAGAPSAGVADMIASNSAQTAVNGPEARRLEPVRTPPTDASMVHDGTARPSRCVFPPVTRWTPDGHRTPRHSHRGGEGSPGTGR